MPCVESRMRVPFKNVFPFEAFVIPFPNGKSHAFPQKAHPQPPLFDVGFKGVIKPGRKFEIITNYSDRVDK